jgi:hypothetical protein
MNTIFVVKKLTDLFLKLLECLTLKRKEKLCFVRITKKEDRKVSRR